MDRSQAESGSRAFAVLMAVMLAVMPATLFAQLPRIQPRGESPWWLSGGVVALQIGGITDGLSNTRWQFGPDPLWQVRAAVERTVQDDGVAVGVSLAYGSAGLFAVNQGIQPLSTPEGCSTSCRAEMDLWTVMATFRAGGQSRGFGSMLEGGIGFTGFTNLRTTSGEEFTSFKNAWDFTASLGGGLFYGFSNNFHLTLTQDFGIGFHRKTNLPEGEASTFRPRTTRFGIRYGFGAR